MNKSVERTLAHADNIANAASFEDALSAAEDYVAENKATELAAETLTADIANTITGWFKAQTKPWQLMSYDEQSALISGASKLSHDTVREAVQIIAAEGRKTISAHLEKVEFGDKGIKATVTASKSSQFRHDLSDAQGLDILIVVADAGEFTGGELQGADAPKNGQEELPLEDDDKPVFDQTDNGQVE